MRPLASDSVSLIFRGGLELSSSHKQFGGLSSIRVGANGSNFLAVTDRAYWLRGRITYRGAVPAGIADAEIAPMLCSDGRPITARGWYDTEALAEDGGIAYVGIERVHQILKFDYAKARIIGARDGGSGAARHGQAAEQQGHRMPGGRAKEGALRSRVR